MKNASWESLSAGSMESALERYGRAARAITIAWARRSPSWTAYAAAGGSALALASGAQAAIIYSGPQNLTASVTEGAPESSQTQPINFTGAGTKFFISAHFLATTTYYSAFFLYYGEVDLEASTSLARAVGNNTYFQELRQFGAGVVVDANLFALHGTADNGADLYNRTIAFTLPSYTFAGTSNAGTWTSTNTAFAAVRFQFAGNTHYGWIRLHWEDQYGVGGGSEPDGLPDTVTAIDWAWNNTPNAPIATGAVPEPGTALLSLLAAGSVGVLAWKRRRVGRASWSVRESAA
jgi:hypothetical protein